jgi:hypothetical protein
MAEPGPSVVKHKKGNSLTRAEEQFVKRFTEDGEDNAHITLKWHV